MVRIAPLPESLIQTPFTVYESRVLGVPPERLRAEDLSDGVDGIPVTAPPRIKRARLRRG